MPIKIYKHCFTLVELAVVCVIIAILASVAVSSFSGYSSHAVYSRLSATATQLNHAQDVFKAQNLIPKKTPLINTTDPVDDAFSRIKDYLPGFAQYETLSDFYTKIKSDARLLSLPYKISYVDHETGGTFVVEPVTESPANTNE